LQVAQQVAAAVYQQLAAFKDAPGPLEMAGLLAKLTTL